MEDVCQETRMSPPGVSSARSASGPLVYFAACQAIDGGWEIPHLPGHPTDA